MFFNNNSQNYQNYYPQPMLKWYNPNKFNILDGGIAFFAAVALFVLLFLLGGFLPTFSDYYLGEIVYSIIIQGIIFLIAFSISKLRNVGMLNGGGYKARFKPKDMLLSVVFIIGVLLVFAPIAELFVNGIFTKEQQEVVYPAVEGDYLFMFVYIFLISTIFPAICEEFLMRGVVLRGVENVAGKYMAVAVSAVLFMLLHRSPMQTISQLAGGFALGFVMVRTRNILNCILMHLCNNLFAVFYYIILEFFAQNSMTVAGNVILIVIGVICLAVGIYYFCLPEKCRIKRKKLFCGNKFYYNSMGFNDKNEYEEYIETLKGNYYYAAKIPDENVQNAYADKISKWKDEIVLSKEKNPPAYFYVESGWKKLNTNTKRGKIFGIVMLALGAAACAAIWIYQFIIISSL